MGVSPTLNPEYDEDGNGIAYPLPALPTTLSTLSWDAENRLIEAKNATGITLEKNLLDSGSRKIATTANGVTTVYLYDAWNCIAEYTQSVPAVSAVLSKTRLWGTDLSGSQQGAGGVGGLLSETINNQPSTFNYFPTYDGNGNISEYLAANGNVTAHFEYDPFGNTVVNTDTNNQFTYRFSTKPLSFATGLYYYGYRYYESLTGRWPSRDPIEENGGENLYGFIFNSPINFFDDLGHQPRSQAKDLQQQRRLDNSNGRNRNTTEGISNRANSGAATLDEAASRATNIGSAVAEVPKAVAGYIRGKVDDKATGEAATSCTTLLENSGCKGPLCSNSCSVVFRRRFDQSGVAMGNEFISSKPRPCKSCSQEDDPQSGHSMNPLGGPGFTSAPKIKVPGVGVFPPIYEDEASSYAIEKTCLDIIIK